MANYTCYLYEIIRDMANPAIPSYDFSALINDSWQKICPTKFPIWEEEKVVDENGTTKIVYPRDRIVKKILAHYFMWEIGYENQNIWLFAFNRKISEIMPYYVELYKTIGYNFNPFITTDMKEVYEGLGSVKKEGSEDSTKDDTLDSTKNGGFSETLKREGTEGTTSSESGSLKKTGTDKTENSEDETENVTSSINYGKKETVSGTTNGSKNEVTNYGSINTHTKTGTEKNNGSEWNTFSDTPQGTLIDVENERYLTDARHIVTNNTLTYDTIDKDQKTGKDSVDTTTSDTNSNSTTFSGTDTTTDENSKNSSGISTITHNTTDTSSKSGSGTRTEDFTDKRVGENSENLNSTAKQILAAKSKNSEDSTKNYTKTTTGRNSSDIASQIALWRELIINIEMMIVEDMQSLFMQVF